MVRISASPHIASLISEIFAATVLAETLSFQDGAAGYQGTRDTTLAQSAPGTIWGTAEFFEWDGDDPFGSGLVKAALIRFDDVFSNGVGQIPPASVIISAELSYTVFDPGHAGNVHEVLVDWDESVTYGGFGGTPGIQPGEYGELITTAPGVIERQLCDVTASVARWSADPAANRGWIILPSGPNGVEIRASEYLLRPDFRPKLTVEFAAEHPVQLVRPPYLQRGSPASMTIVWRTAIPSIGRVHFGTAPQSLTGTVTDPVLATDHVVTVSGLSPMTKYYYAVGTDVEILAGGDEEHFFATSPRTGSPALVTAWVLGDSGYGSQEQLDVRDAMLAVTGPSPPALLVHVGDIAYLEGTDEQFTDRFFTPYQEILRHSVCWPTLGNHESESSDSATQTGPYYRAFVLPTAAEAGGLASGTEAYYSFDYGNVHFISLNSDDVDRAEGSEMLMWLSADLASTEQPWRVAFWHHPPYTKGTHDSDDVADSDGRMRDMRENVLPILDAGGVDLVLGGHSHIYERSFFLTGAYDTPTTAEGHVVDYGDGRPAGDGAYSKCRSPGAGRGAVYVVAGHGGAPIGGPGDHPLMYFSEVAYGSCLLSVSDNILTLANIRSDGAVTDYFAIIKGPSIGDCDGDADVDTIDLVAFTGCLDDASRDRLVPQCACSDLDGDLDVDLADFACLQFSFSR